MKSLLGSLAILIILMPWFLKSLADGSINLNGLALNLFETVSEVITRQPAEWQAPATGSAATQREVPPQRREGGL